MSTTYTLPEVIRRLRAVHDELDRADRDLKRARDTEVAALEAYRIAKARAFLDDGCPRPKRGENGVTVADRDAWIDRHCTAEREKARGCEAIRQAAWDHLQVVRDQASLVQTIANLVKVELAMLGTTP